MMDRHFSLPLAAHPSPAYHSTCLPFCLVFNFESRYDTMRPRKLAYNLLLVYALAFSTLARPTTVATSPSSASTSSDFAQPLSRIEPEGMLDAVPWPIPRQNEEEHNTTSPLTHPTPLTPLTPSTLTAPETPVTPPVPLYLAMHPSAAPEAPALDSGLSSPTIKYRTFRRTTLVDDHPSPASLRDTLASWQALRDRLISKLPDLGKYYIS